MVENPKEKEMNKSVAIRNVENNSEKISFAFMIYICGHARKDAWHWLSHRGCMCLLFFSSLSQLKVEFEL